MASVPPGDVPTRSKRDEDYYFDDGSAVFLVDDTLFKVHRSLLCRDGSTFFSTLFSVPQGALNEQGKSDGDPIELHGESASEFKWFLFTLYALPPDLQTMTSPNANLPALISIARKANKYQFQSLETWALQAIQDYVNRQPSPILDSIPCPTSYVYSPADSQDLGNACAPDNLGKSTSHLTRLICLAQLCGHTSLLNTMINTLRELMSASLQYAYLAMTLSDKLDLAGLRGAAYLEVMQKAEIVKPLELDLSRPVPESSAPSEASDNTTPVNSNNLVIGAMANALAPLSGGPNPFSASTSTPSSSGSSSLAASPQLPVSNPKPAPRPSLASLPITPSQQLRLLSGYYRLAHTWEHLRSTPPAFEHAPACGTTWHQHGCTQAWLEFWTDKTTKSDAVLALGAADVLGRLKAIQKEYERWGSAAYMHNECRLSARKRIGEVVKKVEGSLGSTLQRVEGCSVGVALCLGSFRSLHLGMLYLLVNTYLYLLSLLT